MIIHIKEEEESNGCHSLEGLGEEWQGRKARPDCNMQRSTEKIRKKKKKIWAQRTVAQKCKWGRELCQMSSRIQQHTVSISVSEREAEEYWRWDERWERGAGCGITQCMWWATKDNWRAHVFPDLHPVTQMPTKAASLRQLSFYSLDTGALKMWGQMLNSRA